MFSERSIEFGPIRPHCAPHEEEVVSNQLVLGLARLGQNGNFDKNRPLSGPITLAPSVDVDPPLTEDDVDELLGYFALDEILESIYGDLPPVKSVAARTRQVDTRLARRVTVVSAASPADFSDEQCDEMSLLALSDEYEALLEALREADAWGDLGECAEVLAEIATNLEDQDETRRKIRQACERRRQDAAAKIRRPAAEHVAERDDYPVATNEFETKTSNETELDRLTTECGDLCQSFFRVPPGEEREKIRVRLRKVRAERERLISVAEDASESKSEQSSEGAFNFPESPVPNHGPTETVSSRPRKPSRRVLAVRRREPANAKKKLRRPVNSSWKLIVKVALGRAAFLLRVGFPKT
jgi:hypothetical protein